MENICQLPMKLSLNIICTGKNNIGLDPCLPFCIPLIYFNELSKMNYFS